MKQTLLVFLVSQLCIVNLFTQEIRQLADFSEVHAAAGVKVILVKSTETKAKLELENCSSEDIVTEVKGDRLVVKFANSRNWSRSKNRKAIITVYFQDIDGLGVSSGATISAENVILSSELSLSGSSGGMMEIDVEAITLEAEVSSGGILRVKGQSEVLILEVSSGGVFKSYDLASMEADVDASSGGVASFTVSQELKADASSGGVIRYMGSPEKLHTNASSAGTIRAQ
jgi:hypothetical protein